MRHGDVIGSSSTPCARSTARSSSWPIPSPRSPSRTPSSRPVVVGCGCAAWSSSATRVAGSAVPKLKRAGVDVREDGNCGLMHDKVFVVDGRTVVTGSFNWTRQAQEANDENAVFADNQWLAQRYADEFERIYTQAASPMRCGN